MQLQGPYKQGSGSQPPAESMVYSLWSEVYGAKPPEAKTLFDCLTFNETRKFAQFSKF